MSARRIIVSGLELIASVGVYEHEKRYEQRVAVSLELSVDDDYDGYSDRLDHVYDYDLAIRAVRSTIAEGPVHLLETLAERIAQRCLADPRVQRITLRIEKPDVLPACKGIGIEITRQRM